MPFCSENIGRWSGYYTSSKSFNSGCNGQEEEEKEGGVKTEMPFYTRAPLHSLTLRNSTAA